ncbi:MAG TPA: 1,4-alpha-glucan branching protein GlgB [Thermoanaerobaculia bacterium]|nr:1,4-alpha-glucan branching protein GlgB [Thermoanaerobaculia bacterium]
MAVRKKSGGSDGSKKAAPRKRATTGKTVSAPRKRATPQAAAEELVHVGGDVVPTVPVEAEVLVPQPDAVLSEAGPILTDADVETGFSPNVETGFSPSDDGGLKPALHATRPETLLSDWDIHLFNEGTHHKLWEKLGNHAVPGGVMFGVWAPNADRVSVIGDFNGWNADANPLHLRGASGIWEGFIPDLPKGSTYKYRIVSQFNNYSVDKADPFAVHHETPPATASKVWDLEYDWNDEEWMRTRKARNAYDAPMSIYEVHLGSWLRTDDNQPYSYRDIAQPLADYVKKMNFTHIELMPVQEHPFYGSWGYQGTGYFAPTSRFGTPQDFKYLIDLLHQNGIGVILDWVPSHFPTDEHGLGYFDGTHLFEHSDPRKGFQPDWGSLVFNYGRNEVRAFLLSSALYWLDEYHIDGLRVDAVASMLYLDYSRKHGEWVPNEFGGRENIEAIAFLRRLNEDVYKVHPDVQVIAEESTAWPMVSRPTYVGGLGFGMKWDMGWMHDTLNYFQKDPVHRKFHHNGLTFRMMYAFTENFVLPLSHDEVVHGKGSLLGKMRGDEWQRFANLRLLYAHMYANPGKKLLFMGADIGQYREWNHDAGLDWHLLEYPFHAGVNRWLEDLNKAYRDIPAMHELDMSPEGFEWIDCCDTENSIVSMTRHAKTEGASDVVVVMNYTPLERHNYQIGVPRNGHWREVLNSDATLYGGSGQGNMGGVDASPIPLHGRRWSVTLTLPPLGAVFLMNEAPEE